MAMQELGQLTSLEVLNLSSCWQITIEGLRRLSGIQGWTAEAHLGCKPVAVCMLTLTGQPGGSSPVRLPADAG